MIPAALNDIPKLPVVRPMRLRPRAENHREVVLLLLPVSTNATKAHCSCGGFVAKETKRI